MKLIKVIVVVVACVIGYKLFSGPPTAPTTQVAAPKPTSVAHVDADAKAAAAEPAVAEPEEPRTKTRDEMTDEEKHALDTANRHAYEAKQAAKKAARRLAKEQKAFEGNVAAAVRTLFAEGVASRIEGGKLYVRPRWFLIDVQAKEAAAKIGYAQQFGREPGQTLHILNALDGHEIGTFTLDGGLDI